MDELSVPHLQGPPPSTRTSPRALPKWTSILAALIPATLYLIYVTHYSVNVPWSVDDWSIVALIRAAHQPHFGFHDVWNQYGDRRLVVSRLLFLGFASIGRLNLREVIAFAALTYIVSFVLFALLLRKYLGRPVSTLPLLITGFLWFGLGQSLNALWSFQLSWYLVVLFFMCMLACLCLPAQLTTPWLGFAMLVAFAGTISDVQGVLLWPIGFVCILWKLPLLPAQIVRGALWLLATAGTLTLYFWGFSFSNAQCIPRVTCSLAYEAHHPSLMLRCLLILLGNVFPTFPSPLLGLHQVLGFVLLIGAGGVLFHSRQTRRVDPALSLPVTFILFGLLFDSLILESRSGEGIGQMASDQYVMPNLFVLVGIGVYVFSQVRAGGRGWSRSRFRVLLVNVTGLACVAQIVVSTQYGLTSGTARHAQLEIEARVITNEARIPATEWPCYAASTAFLWVTPAIAMADFQPDLVAARRYRLSIFGDGAEVRSDRAAGPPSIGSCVQ